jgi:methionine sulfoxide reductase heme-binding subunit
MNSQALWYLSRGSGIVVLLLLTLAVVAGVATAGRWSTHRWPRFVVEGLHRNLSLLATVFLGVHISSTVLDTYVNIRWIDAVVPFQALYKPVWLGLGALAFDLFLALAITSLIRSRLGYKTWRAVHWLAYGCWGFGLLHGLGIGSDRHQTWMLSLYAACAVAVGAATLVRLAPIMRRALAPVAP